MSPALILDNREPEAHPWLPTLTARGMAVEWGTLETGDLALACNPAVCVERKSGPDFLAGIGGERERFERELKRSRYCDAFAVIVESDLASLLASPRALHPSAILGSVAAWSRRYGPILFAGTPEIAADLAIRFVTQPVAEARKLVAAT